MHLLKITLSILFFTSTLATNLTYCDDCPSGCCNEWGGCPSVWQSCSCKFETSYQLFDGLKCKNCCNNKRCISDSQSDQCDSVKAIQNAGKIAGIVIGALFGFCFLVALIIIIRKKIQRRNQANNNNYNNNVQKTPEPAKVTQNTDFYHPNVNNFPQQNNDNFNYGYNNNNFQNNGAVGYGYPIQGQQPIQGYPIQGQNMGYPAPYQGGPNPQIYQGPQFN